MGCKDLGVQALWEYVYGPSGIGPGAPWGPGKPKILFFVSGGLRGPLLPFPYLGHRPFLGPRLGIWWIWGSRHRENMSMDLQGQILGPHGAQGP